MLHHIRRLQLLRVPAIARYSTQTPPPTNDGADNAPPAGLFADEKKKGAQFHREKKKRTFKKRNDEASQAQGQPPRTKKSKEKITMPALDKGKSEF